MFVTLPAPLEYIFGTPTASFGTRFGPTAASRQTGFNRGSVILAGFLTMFLWPAHLILGTIDDASSGPWVTMYVLVFNMF